MPGDGPSRAEWRRLRRRGIEERQRRTAERDAFLGSSLETGERVVARISNHPLVTDRRIIDAKRQGQRPRPDEWVLDAVMFSEVTGRRHGRLHDGRPLIELEHPPHMTIDRVPPRRFLWFTWGNTEGPVTHTTTTYGFGRVSNPVFVAITGELDRRKVPQGPTFVIRPAGARTERLRNGQGLLREYREGRLRFGMWRVTDVLYRGQLAWPIRVVSWLLVAAPAWFVSPWLVVPAIIGSELAWIVVMQVMWLRLRARQR
jgi:hypothetical protein